MDPFEAESPCLSRINSVSSIKSNGSCTSKLEELMAAITSEIEQNFEVADLIVASNSVESQISLQHCTLGVLKMSQPVMSGLLQKHSKSAKLPSPTNPKLEDPKFKERFFILTHDGKLFLFTPTAIDSSTPLSYLILIASTNNGDVTSSTDASVFKVWGNNIHPESGALQKHSWILKSENEETTLDWIDGINRVASCAQEELLVKLERRFSTSRSGRGSRLSVEQASMHRRSVSLMGRREKRERPVTASGLEAPVMARDSDSAHMFYGRARSIDGLNHGLRTTAKSVVVDQSAKACPAASPPVTPSILSAASGSSKSTNVGYLKPAQKKTEWFKWLVKPPR
ncbi:hypothetical protein BDR26DRAFT_853794 [Obelidium mucronatum]|nr:hypothetical protein BDR26DRAFT_853794 [Obelidium mucronatum]